MAHSGARVLRYKGRHVIVIPKLPPDYYLLGPHNVKTKGVVTFTIKTVWSSRYALGSLEALSDYLPAYYLPIKSLPVMPRS